MSNDIETQETKKFKLARTPNELIFNTDTDQSDYPIFVDPLSARMYIKHEPEDVDHYSVFYVRSVVHVAKEEETRRIMDDAEKQGLFDKKAFELVLDAFKSLGLNPKVYHKEITYEVYKGNYEEMVGGGVKAYAVFIEAVVSKGWAGTVERNSPDEKRQWAIAYSYLKRLKVQLGSNLLFEHVYLKRHDVSRRRYEILLVAKFGVPTQEFFDAFDKAVLEYAHEIQSVPTAVGVEEEQQQPQQAPQPQISLEEIKPQELEVEIPETPQPPQPQPQSQLQLQPQPIQQMEVELGVTPTPQPIATPTKQELVRIYLLAMRLPTKHLLMQSEYERDGNGVLREVRRWDGKIAQIASRVEGIRRDAYARLSRVFCHVEEYGVWVTVSEDGVREAQSVSKFVIEELKKLGIDKIKNINIEGKYGVRVVPIYLEPEEAKNLLEAAIAHLSKDVEELEKKIEEAKKSENKKYLRWLEQEKSYRKALLESFRKYLTSL